MLRKPFLFLFILVNFALYRAHGQSPHKIDIFKDVPVNFGGKKADTFNLDRRHNGRLIFKKVKVLKYKKGTDVDVILKLRSEGDPWDKSGSLFIITDPEKVDMLDVLDGINSYPSESGINGYPGIWKSKNYTPALELLRFMTPFGVGYFSDEGKNPRIRHNRPVYIPAWEKEVVWKEDISHLAEVVTGEFLIGIWIDVWTPEGYAVDLSLEYSGRPAKELEVLPLVNTIYYAEQKHPDLFATTDLICNFNLPVDAENVQLHYITTGHGGHSGGDEFIKLNNRVHFDRKIVIDTIPWRDDCASFRRYNPSSGVWIRKDTAYAYTSEGKRELREIEERLASSDLSRSNWCPGSVVQPINADLGSLKKGEHSISISIDGTPIEGDKLNHWLVSAYLTYETRKK